MKKTLAFLLIFSFYFGYIYSQESPKVNKNYFVTANEKQTDYNLRNLKLANKYYKNGIYDEAYKHYLLLYNQIDTIKSLNYRLGISALKENYASSAVSILEKSSPVAAKDYYYRLGQAYQINHLYEEAYRSYDKYVNSLSKYRQKKFFPTFIQLRDECRFALTAVKDSLPYFVTNLGEAVNSYYDEYSPVILNSSNTLYYTSRQPKKSKSKKVLRSSVEENIKITNFNIDGSTTSTHFRNVEQKGNVSVAGKNSANDQLLYYVGKKRLGNIYSLQIQGTQIRNRKKIKGAVNRKTIHTPGLSISSLGEAAFISDKNKYKKGYDIYFSESATHKRIKGEVSAGQFINSTFDERSVSFSEDGKTIYFSSNGLEGFGGYDIYKIERLDDGSWSEPINLGYPINTAADELFYFPTPDSLVAIVASNREGGYGGLDLYQVVKDIRIPFTIWGDILDSENSKPIYATVSVIDRITNSLVSSANSDSISGEYLLAVEDVGNYVVQAEADGYLSATEILEMPTERHSQIRQDFQLQRLATPFTFFGKVLNEANDEPISATISIKDIDSDSIVGRSYTNSYDGSYSVTVGDKHNVIMTFSTNNFFSQTDTFMLRDHSEDRFQHDVKLVRSKIDYIVTGVVTDSKDQTPVAASLAFYEPGSQTPVTIVNADTLSGKYTVSLDDEGPFITEVNAEGYFFANLPIVFSGDSTLIIRNIELQKMSAGSKIVVENILFDTGKATLLPQSFTELNKLARLLIENEEIRIEVSGHTDNTGSAAFNKRLSRSRAESVRNYLIEKGVDGMRMQFEGYGFDRPIESNDTAEGRAANRRVEIEVIE